jgi:glutathione reductase (NADPH)
LVRDIPLRQVDTEVVNNLVENMGKLGLDVKLKCPFTKVTKNEESGLFSVHTSTNEVFEAERVLLAMGRPPCVKGLGLENAGIEVSSSGFVNVDENHFTNVPGIYAIGDVTNHE